MIRSWTKKVKEAMELLAKWWNIDYNKSRDKFHVGLRSENKMSEHISNK